MKALPLQLLAVAQHEADAHELRTLLHDAAGQQALRFQHTTSIYAFGVSPDAHDLVLWIIPNEIDLASMVREIRSLGPAVPIVLLRKIASSCFRIEGLQGGACTLTPATPDHGAWLAQSLLCTAAIRQMQRSNTAQQYPDPRARAPRLFEHSLVGILRCSLGGQLMACNSAVTRMFGYRSTAELLSEPLWRLYPDRLRCRKLLAQLPQEGQPINLEIETFTKEGTPLWVLASFSRLPQGPNGFAMVEGTFIDVSALQDFRGQLLQAQKMETLGQLAGGIAHDFNNLLMVICGYADLMLEALPAHDSLHRQASEILNAGRRATGLTRQLLNFGRQTPQPARVLDLNTVARECSQFLSRLIGEDVLLDLRECRGLWGVRIDPTHVEQILLNLASNARDAMPRGGTLTIAFENTTLNDGLPLVPGDYVLLTVSDTGSGIPPAVAARIFEPFFTTKKEGKGSGLGLATVHTIVKDRGGAIQLDTSATRGTTFRIYLPRARAAVEDSPRLGTGEPSLGGSETILLVEDDAPLRAVMHQFLTGQGYNVLIAPDGLAALQTAKSHPGVINLLITDIVLPHMSGCDLTNALASLRISPRVLYISGYGENAVQQRGHVDMQLTFLAKPFSLGDLSQKIRQVLATASEREAAMSRAAGA